MDIRIAQTFIEQNGSPIERIRLAALISRQPLHAIPTELAVLQNEDHGFPYELRPGAPSALYQTATLLQWLYQLGLDDMPASRNAAAFLTSHQTSRGIWRESRELQSLLPPPWMDPDSTDADIYTTAYCAATLALYDPTSLFLDRAANWLQSQQGRDGLLHGWKFHASWLTVPVFAAIFGQEARATRRLIGGLGRAINGEWPPSMLASLLMWLLEGGYTMRTDIVAHAWVLLRDAQAPDGSFATEEGMDDTVEATQTALAVALRLRDAAGGTRG